MFAALTNSVVQVYVSVIRLHNNQLERFGTLVSGSISNRSTGKFLIKLKSRIS